nr:MAG TPA: protein of unknown function DUF2075 [Caudoviricetes sp.]
MAFSRAKRGVAILGYCVAMLWITWNKKVL